MRRAALERPRTIKEWKKHVAIVHEGKVGHCVCDRQPNRFRKFRALGCKVSQCHLCHSDKLVEGRGRGIQYKRWIQDQRGS